MLAIWTAIIFGKRWRCCSKTLRKTLMKWQPKCKSFRLWMFSKGGSMGDWDGTFFFFCSLLILKFKSVLEKCPTEHHWERLRKILFSFFMPFQIIFKEYFFADFLKGMNDGGENFHCFFSKSNFGRDCIKYAQLQT